MSTWTFYQSYDMTQPFVWYGDVTLATSTQIRIQDPIRTQNYYGSFSYSGGYVSGVLTGADSSLDGLLQWTVTGEWLDAATMAYYIQSGTADAALDFALSASDTLYGSVDDDTIRGGAGDDMLFGNDGSDLLLGDEGSDLMVGGAGSDLLIGYGSDEMTGGMEIDYFSFTGLGHYVINDFMSEDYLLFEVGVPNLASLLSYVTRIEITPAGAVVEFGGYNSSITLVGNDLTAIRPDQLLFV